MKKTVLLLFSVCVAFLSFSQVAVTGISPASVVGNYNFVYGETSSGWGLALDFSLPGVHVQGELALVEDGTPGTNPQGHPISQEGCNALTNGSAVNGKIAVVYRNTCEFGKKAKMAQDAGAIGVIIINRDNIVTSNIGPGADGATVTIPVILIASMDGQLITGEMANGPVEMFIGNKAGLTPNDLALDQRLILTPRYNGVHSLLSQDATEFNMELGMRIYNYGSATQTGATVNAKITGPGSTVVYDQTVTFDLDGVVGNIVDSVDVFPGEALNFPTFSLATYPAGEYTLEYTITGANGPDNFPNDNTYSIPFVVNNSAISRSRLNPSTNLPIVDIYTGPAKPVPPAQPYQELRFCFFFRDAHASRLAAVGLNTSVSVDTSVSNDLLGKTIFAEFYNWNDNFVNYTDAGFGYTDLVSAASAQYDFLNPVDTEDVYLPFDPPLVLVDNQKYLVCLVSYDPSIYIGYDRNVDFNATQQQYGELTNPLYISPDGTGWYGGGFGADLTPSISIHAIDVNSLSVKKAENLAGSAYPNPANDLVNFNVPMNGKATVLVSDLAGRTVVNHTVDFVNNHTSVSIADLTPGMYVFTVVNENGAKTTFNIAKK